MTEQHQPPIPDDVLADAERLAWELRNLLDTADGRLPLRVQSAVVYCIDRLREVANG